MRSNWKGIVEGRFVAGCEKEEDRKRGRLRERAE